MPYFSKPDMRFALDSFCHFYGGRKDYEIVIVEDSKNNNIKELHDTLISIVDKFKERISIRLIVDPIESYNPSTKYNLGVKESVGDRIILTNPETPHTMDILSELDLEDFNSYIVCACSSVFLIKDGGSYLNSEFKFHYWFQHTTLGNNFNYHFCTVISRENYSKCGGFDERFSKGIAYEDANFVKRVLKNQIRIKNRDDLITYHIEHSRDYSLNDVEREKRIKINDDLWNYQLRTGDF
jgi:hypothetical protein